MCICGRVGCGAYAGLCVYVGVAQVCICWACGGDVGVHMRVCGVWCICWIVCVCGREVQVCICWACGGDAGVHMLTCGGDIGVHMRVCGV